LYNYGLCFVPRSIHLVVNLLLRLLPSGIRLADGRNFVSTLMAEVIRLLQATFLYLVVFAPEAETSAPEHSRNSYGGLFYIIGIPPSGGASNGRAESIHCHIFIKMSQRLTLKHVAYANPRYNNPEAHGGSWGR
jgi:hypothetical protein